MYKCYPLMLLSSWQDQITSMSQPDFNFSCSLIITWLIYWSWREHLKSSRDFYLYWSSRMLTPSHVMRITHPFYGQFYIIISCNEDSEYHHHFDPYPVYNLTSQIYFPVQHHTAEEKFFDFMIFFTYSSTFPTTIFNLLLSFGLLFCSTSM